MEQIILFFARNKMLVNILVMATFLIGGYCYFNIRQESFPSTDLDMVLIQAIYPGATPLDVEKNAVIPIEEELQSITGIEEYTSIIIENAAIIKVKIDQTLDDTRPTKDEIFRKMQNVPDISTDVEQLNVIDANPDLMSIYTIGINFKEGQVGTEDEIYKYSRILEDDLRRLDGVAEVRISGRTDPEVQIYVDPYGTQKYYLSLLDIVNAVEMRNVRITGGNLKTPEKELTVVTMGEFINPIDVKDVIIRSTFDGQRVRVDDVAKINEGFVEKTVLMRVNKNPGYSLSIVKKENADILNTIKTVNKYFEDNKDLIPSNMQINPMQDNSRTIVSLLNVVTSNIISGFIIIFIVLLIFLDIKSALYTSFAMLIIIFGTLIFMTGSGITFNIISLAAVITVLGMIVDNSIVISENIFNFKQAGYKGLEATKLAVLDVVMPIIVSSMTTITAFAPMLFIEGIMGKFVNQFPKVVIAAIIISFFQSIFILPNQLQDKAKKPKDKDNAENENKKKKRKNIFNYDRNKLFEKMKVPFGFILSKLLKIRYAVIIFFVLLLFGSIFLAQDSFKRFVLIYDTSSDTIVINLDAGVGTTLDKTLTYLEQIESIVLNTVRPEELIAIYTLAGQQVDQDIISEELGSLGGIMVYLVPSVERERIADDISLEINKEVDKTDLRKELKILNISVKSTMKAAGKAVDVKIVGNDTEKAKIVKDQVKEYLLSIDGIINYEDDDKLGKEELRIIFDYNKIAELGINVATAAREVRTAYYGTVATYIQGLDNKLEFRVQLETNATKSTNSINKLLIPNNNNRLVYLENIAKIESTNGLSTIRHFDGERAITITSDIEKGITTSKQVMDMVKEKFKNVPIDYPGISLIFGGEAKETVKSLTSLLFSFAIAIILIYIVLLLQFKRIVQPLLILLIIPFGLIGVLLAFAAHGMPMSFMGFIGLIGLAGVVVNNGIIMVDLINKILDEGVENGKQGVFDAIVEGTKSRLRPVFLTTATTILGLMPTVYGIGGKADVIVPIVMALAYGLLFASLLTLIFLPCIFMISFDLKLFKLPEPADGDINSVIIRHKEHSELNDSQLNNSELNNANQNKLSENSESSEIKSSEKKKKAKKKTKKAEDIESTKESEDS